MIKTSAAGSVTWEESDLISSDAPEAETRKLKISKPSWCKKWSIGMTDFKDGIVGAKSKNLANLRGKLPEWIRLPPSVALPFGCFEAVLEDSENKEIAKELKNAINEVIKNEDMSGLAKCREITERIHIPKAAKEELVKVMDESGVPVPRSEEGWSQAVRALKSVWASKFNERAFTSTKRVGLNFNDVTMAVLVQRVVSARYAFVIHTTNPMSGDENEIYCELVKGMGESIVSGTVPGSALAFKARKDDLDNPTIVLYPSKSQGMFVKEDSLIFRSDSNGEDLEGYAGAGLYDSITTAVMSQEVVDYSSDPIVADAAFAKDIMSRVCKVGAAIEKYLKSPQDIEGVVDPDLNITVVQTRPQM
jgi:alpha-glucan,water dikinase